MMSVQEQLVTMKSEAEGLVSCFVQSDTPLPAWADFLCSHSQGCEIRRREGSSLKPFFLRHLSAALQLP